MVASEFPNSGTQEVSRRSVITSYSIHYTKLYENHFITIANIDSPQPELIQEGNQRVIRPRLADAMFFWQQDGKRRLEDHLDSLKQVVFQKQLA